MKTQFVIEKLSPLKLSEEEVSLLKQHISDVDSEMSAVGEDSDQRAFLWKPAPRSDYERVKCNEVTFVFKYDDKKQDMLHIYSRHMTTPDDVFYLFFNQDPVWDEEHKRCANFSDTHGLYWFWLNEEKRVAMVISCFKRQLQ